MNAKSPCRSCGVPNADILDASGELVCRGCAATAEANARLAAGRRSGVTGAKIGIVFGAVLLTAGLLVIASTMGGPRSDRRFGGRLAGVMIGFGIVAVVGSAQNLRRLRGTMHRSGQ